MTRNLLLSMLMVSASVLYGQKPSKLLYEGITKGDLAKVQKAVEAGADVNKPVSMKRPIDWALQTHRADVLQYLIEKGADVNDKSMTGTPLQMYASTVETPEEKAEWLIKFYKKYKVDTVIETSWYSSIAEITKIMLDAGADPNVKDISGRTVVQVAIEIGIKSEDARAQFVSAVFQHAKRPDINQRLITIDAKKQNHLDFTMKDGKLKDPDKFPTALMICAKMNYLLIAKALVDNGADINMTVNIYGNKAEGNFYSGMTLYATKKQYTALDIARMKKNSEMVAFLESKGAQ